jgi:hypothetical protein
VLAGVVSLLAARPGYDTSMNWVTGTIDTDADWRAARMRQHIMTGSYR